MKFVEMEITIIIKMEQKNLPPPLLQQLFREFNIVLYYE